MAQASTQDEDEMIVGINVTPLVDVVLVLLVVLMVTATYIAARTIPVDLPKGATGEATNSPLAVSIDAGGQVYLDGEKIQEPAMRSRLRLARRRNPELRAVIAADGKCEHRSVVRVIDLLRQEQIVRFAINVQPEDIAPARN